MKIQPVRGTHDLYGYQVNLFKKIADAVNNFASIYNFKQIITPIFESTSLFQKPLGEQSDVVLKEMYTFKDRNDSLLTLRPEHTTPILRSAISNNLIDKLPQKLFCIGPVFRRERPQKGRYRQFNQINFEILGTHDEFADVELIAFADKLLKNLLPKIKITLHINSLGDPNTLKIYNNELNEYFKKNLNKLSEESKLKISSNPLRILDSKNINDKEIIKKAPKISDYYSTEAEKKFLSVQKLLDAISIDYIIDHSLVRGLDYYCHSVFEFKTDELGSQGTIIGGGRYDGLLKVIGGPDIPGVGWAAGIERIIMLMDKPTDKEKIVHLIIINEQHKKYGLKIANQLRDSGIKIYFDYKYNLKKSLALANQLNSEYAIIIGEEEFANNTCSIKNLNQNIQEKKTIEEIIKILI